MNTRLVSVLAAALVLAGLAVVTAAHAGAIDHLKCFRIRDSLTDRRTIYLADLFPEAPFSAQQDCRLTLPARHFCVNVTKTNVQVGGEPYDTIDVPAGDARDYLCYKVKCDRDRPALDLLDQFGVRPVRIRRSDFLCMPANKTAVLATPTPVLTPTPTPTETPNPCQLQALPGDTGTGAPRPIEQGVCGGDCDAGQLCLFASSPTSRDVGGCECVDASTQCGERVLGTGTTPDPNAPIPIMCGGFCPGPHQLCGISIGESPAGTGGACQCFDTAQ
jgi:hypothetical protein